MDVGMDVGWLLDRFLVEFGTILGAKLAPKWHQNPKKWNPKTMSENGYQKCTKRAPKWHQNENISLPAEDGYLPAGSMRG